MIFGKDVEELKEKVAGFDQRFQELATLLQGAEEKQEKRFAALETQFQQFSAQVAGELANVAQQLQAVERARGEVEKSTRSFAELQRRIEQFAMGKLGDAIKESVERLKPDAERYGQVKNEIESAVLRLGQLGEEILKFRAIASEVKQADFELSRYAKELVKADEEKVRLMKEVDELQRMVAKMRRGQHS